MAIKKKSAKVLAAASTYIDPLSCDSTVSYKIIDGSRRLWGDVQLTDCNRKIDWYFGSQEKDAIAKVDKAIDALLDFRNALKSAHETRRKRIRQVAAKKRAATVASSEG